jgi:lysophospholipase L1-like esterase
MMKMFKLYSISFALTLGAGHLRMSAHTLLMAMVAGTAGRLSTNNTVPCTTTPVRTGQTLVSVVGDSITYGYNCNAWQGGFVKVMQDALGSNYAVRDCGVSGTDAVKPNHGEKHPGHPSYWSTSAFKTSMAMNPDVVIIMLGTNDADAWHVIALFGSRLRLGSRYDGGECDVPVSTSC